jgi:ATP-dependent DNA helicase DinG
VPEVPAVPRSSELKDSTGIPGIPGIDVGPLAGAVARVFAPDGLLAAAIDQFEPRPSQVEMASAVSHAIEHGTVLLAEAGTGTGKTLAYLIPAILSRQRVLVSTGTKNLQEQIFFKDVPLLRTALGIPFSVTYMKGRSNYLCLHRLDQLSDQGLPGLPLAASHSVFLPIVQKWAKRTQTGDRAEIEDLPEDLTFWSEVSAAAETCLGTECPRYDDCFVTRMRQQAAAADVVIVNHHLLCADAAVRRSGYGEVIPACSLAIVDEAHQLEEIATQYFGSAVSNYRLEELANDMARLSSPAANPFQLDAILDGVRSASRNFFSDLAAAHRTGERVRNEEKLPVSPQSLADVQDAAAQLTGALDLAETWLLTSATERERDSGEASTDQDARTLARRAAEIRHDIRFLLKANDPGFVYYVEFRGRGAFLRASPIDVSGIVRELLLDKMRSTVLTSATLTVDGSFGYIRSRLGIGAAREIRCASEFDYTQQAVLYLPPKMPDPRSPDFPLAAGRQVIEILKRTQGRAFVLFTSYATLRAVQAVAEMALDYPILVQGTAPRTQLLKRFRQTPHAVLFATASFWQGVDVVGEALSCVIIDKLPFASPGDPITAARIAAIRDMGGEPFDEYQVPLAVLALQQGLGRLIRHRRDRGVLAILDPRLRTKGYGRRFLASLPPTPVVHELDAIERFLSIV